MEYKISTASPHREFTLYPDKTSPQATIFFTLCPWRPEAILRPTRQSHVAGRHSLCQEEDSSRRSANPWRVRCWIDTCHNPALLLPLVEDFSSILL